MIVDRTTRYVDAVPMTEATTLACADALLHSWVSRHGLSRHCTSDNGVEFVSEIWRIMQGKLGIKLNYTPLYTPQANGLCERQNSTIKTSLKAALVEMGEKHKNNWYDFLPWILLMKRVSYQKELDASPSMLVYGSNPAVPGDCLVNPGDDMDTADLQNLVKQLTKLDSATPKQTSSQPSNQIPVLEPPQSVTHVYIKEHSAKGLEAQYRGPFAIISRPSRSTVKIRVGFYANGEERVQVRHWRDLKIAERRSEVEAERPKLGRPKKPPTEKPKPESEDAGKVNKPVPTEKPAQIQTRQVRSTRNQSPNYVSAITLTGPPMKHPFPDATCQLSTTPWSASQEEIEELNRRLSGQISRGA